VELVLGRARERDVARQAPDVARGEIVRVRMLLDVRADAASLDFLDSLDGVEPDSATIVQHAARIRAGDRLRAEHLELLHREDRDLAGSRDDACLAPDRVA